MQEEAGAPGLRRAAVERVAHKRVPEVRQVGPDLVHPAGVQLHLHEAEDAAPKCVCVCVYICIYIYIYVYILYIYIYRERDIDTERKIERKVDR